MCSNPKFSVVIPAYNVAEYIQECLDSIYNQNIKDIEIIVVNDCSTDSTRQILNIQTDTRLIVIDHDVNKGLSSARNSGIAQARGEYVAFVDSDDAWLPYHLELAELFFTEHPDVNWYASDTYSVPEFCPEFYQKELSSNITFLVQDYFKDRKGGIMQFLPSSTVIRRSAIETDELFPVLTRYHEDLAGWLNFGLNSPKVGRTREKTVLYRLQRPGAIMSSFKKDLKFRAKAISDLTTYLLLCLDTRDCNRRVKKYIYGTLFSIHYRLICDSVVSPWYQECQDGVKKLPFSLKLFFGLYYRINTLIGQIFISPYLLMMYYKNKVK